jgi:alanyl-tRNA synthetase
VHSSRASIANVTASSIDTHYSHTLHNHAYICIRRSREAAQQKRTGGARALVLEAEQTAWLASQGIAPTDDSAKYTLQPTAATATVKAIFTHSSGFVDSSSSSDGNDDSSEIGVVLDSTCFYAESGGQTGDQGLLVVSDAVVEVADVQTFGGYSLHLGHVVSGSIKVLPAALMLTIDLVAVAKV